jgi:hypothetical protein
LLRTKLFSCTVAAGVALAISGTCVLGFAATAEAAPTSLVLSQASAFSILGHSCGGIQEKVYATGFASGTGYPTGEVYMSTRCGGSGRGGGGGSTLYSAWANVTWDFTTAVVSYARASTTPTVNPTLVVYDSHGNELYNQAIAGVVNGTQVYSQAYLVLAQGFVPAPRLTGISTTSGPTSGGTSITVTGTGFTGVTAVSFGSTAAKSFTVSTSTSITAVSPVAPAGTVDVTVTNAGGTSATSSADQFAFIAPPTITGVSPNSGPLAGGNWVTVSGTNLSTTNKVSVGGTTTGFNVLSNTSLSVYIVPGETAESVNIAVTTIGGTSARTSADRYTYLAPPLPPTVTDLSPNTGTALGGTTVTIAGTGLTSVVYVSFGGYAAQSFTINSDTSITAVTPALYYDTTVDVTVQTLASGWSATSPADQFTYADPAPTVTGVSPNTGSAAGGDTVTITGTGFTTASDVSFGGTSASFTVNNDGSITATTPAASADGTIDVTVTNFGGTSATSPADQFTYADPAPTVTGVSPDTGSAAGGDTVTITGTGFTTASDVSFGGISASFTVNNDGSITATTPAASADGTIDVTVTNFGGTSATSTSDQFTYADAAPTVTGVSPNTGSAAGGDTVTITGTGFTTASDVSFGGISASFTVNNDGSITAATPAASAAGTIDVTVTNFGGTSATSTSDQFTYM